MAAPKLYLGIAEPGQQKIETIGDIRMDLTTKEEAIELISQLIEQAYEDYESEGYEDEFTN